MLSFIPCLQNTSTCFEFKAWPKVTQLIWHPKVLWNAWQLQRLHERCTLHASRRTAGFVPGTAAKLTWSMWSVWSCWSVSLLCNKPANSKLFVLQQLRLGKDVVWIHQGNGYDVVNLRYDGKAFGLAGQCWLDSIMVWLLCLSPIETSVHGVVPCTETWLNMRPLLPGLQSNVCRTSLASAINMDLVEVMHSFGCVQSILYDAGSMCFKSRLVSRYYRV